MIDDYDEDEYINRVDDWVDKSTDQMKKITTIISERDPDHILPGVVMYHGGLRIPGEINNILFANQRISIR